MPQTRFYSQSSFILCTTQTSLFRSQNRTPIEPLIAPLNEKLKTFSTKFLSGILVYFCFLGFLLYVSQWAAEQPALSYHNIFCCWRFYKSNIEFIVAPNRRFWQYKNYVAKAEPFRCHGGSPVGSHAQHRGRKLFGFSLWVWGFWRSRRSGGRNTLMLI